jgi:hypothetical protein
MVNSTDIRVGLRRRCVARVARLKTARRVTRSGRPAAKQENTRRCPIVGLAAWAFIPAQFGEHGQHLLHSQVGFIAQGDH